MSAIWWVISNWQTSFWVEGWFVTFEWWYNPRTTYCAKGFAARKVGPSECENYRRMPDMGLGELFPTDQRDSLDLCLWGSRLCMHFEMTWSAHSLASSAAHSLWESAIDLQSPVFCSLARQVNWDVDVLCCSWHLGVGFLQELWLEWEHGVWPGCGPLFARQPS